MAGSMMLGWRRHDIERRQRQRDAVPDRERRDDAHERAPRAAEQQQSDQEQDVIGPDQNVMRPGGNERLHHLDGALRRAAVVDAGVRIGVEDDLLAQLALVVDVDERLVERVVRKQVRIDAEGAEVRVRDAIAEPQRLLLFHELDALPLDRQTPIASKIQSWRQDLADALLLLGDERRVHQPFRRDAQLVGHVDDVHDEGALDAPVLEHDVEVAERGGVGPRGAAPAHEASPR